jgi:hypothetical protein
MVWHGASPIPFRGPGAAPPGTGNPPFQVTLREDPSAEQTSGQTGPKIYYQSICMMPPYAHKSFEELRAEDYAKGNRGMAPQQPKPGAGGLFGGAGAGACFGRGLGAAQPRPAFGAGGLFGVGSPGGATPGFGAPTGGGLFGSGGAAAGGFGLGEATPATVGAPTLLGASPNPFRSPAAAPPGTGNNPFQAEMRAALAALRAENDALNNERSCCICLAEPRTHMIEPCRHICICELCCARITDSCPVCRSPLATTSRVYL